jgi:SAM-dependent methyltransferase
MSITNILKSYSTGEGDELEVRFHIKPSESALLKKVINNIKGEQSIEQSINFILTDNKNSRITKILFVNGVKKDTSFMIKKQVMKSTVIDGLTPYKLALSVEKTIPSFDINLSKFARIKLRLSINLEEFPEWRVDLTLVKNVTDIQANIKKDKTVMLFDMGKKAFIDVAPWDYADSLELEIEHVGNDKQLKSESLSDVIEHVFTAIDSSYQDTILYNKQLYNIASYVVTPQVLQQFKGQKGLRDIYNRVWELNKHKYFDTVFPNISNYYLLDKADGVRTLMMIEDNTLYALNNTLKTFKLKGSNLPTTIFDAEYIEKGSSGIIDIYYIFDVLVYEETNIMNTPTTNRVKNISKIVDMCDGYVQAKAMVSLDENYKDAIVKVWNSRHDAKYEMDGIIFTPKNETYKSMKSWKWKPMDYMSIDFLVKRPPKNLLGIIPYITIPGFTLLFLFSGITKQVYDKLKLTTVTGYKKLFPNQNMYKLFPIQFSPSDNPFAYMYYHPNDSKFSIDELVDNVCEFKRINLTTDDGQWDMMKIRHDRKDDLLRGDYYGNNFYIAEYTWQNYSNPLKFEDLIISNTDYMDKGYFHEEKNERYKPVTSFNSFVKTQLIQKHKDSDWLIDLAAGHGQDLFRVSDANIKNAVFIDNDSHALSELILRKHDFQRGIKRLNTRIYTKQINLSVDYETILKSLTILNIPVGGINVIMCNFAIHYLLDTPSTVRNLISLVHTLLKPGGSFFFTAFDGEKIFDLLKTTDTWDLREGEVLKYSIKKNYSSEALEPCGQSVGVLLPFSGGKLYNEYLVNYKFLIEEFTTYGFKLDKYESFGKYLPKFKSESIKNYNNLSEQDIKYLSLYSYCSLVKKR